jgi:alkylation response protein AidB-like acyl-CoA dehydrogenase
MTDIRTTEVGRVELAEWERSQPANFYTSDRNVQSILKYYWGDEKLGEALPRLSQFGAQAATFVDIAVREANLAEKLPRLDRYSAVGERVENVAHSREHDLAGEAIYGSGVMSVYGNPGNNLLALALFYISSYNGEAGHNCPLACTAGIIKTLQHVGSASLQEKYLPRLLDPDYSRRYHGAQFLTEVQGGSDVGTNCCSAREIDSARGTWLLNGEKWFCSNVTADLALVTARPENAPPGTKGLGLFLVPRRLDDGTPNGLHIRRLKDKLGTKSLATAELDFRDALAYEIDARGRGFQYVMDYVVNTSRLYNATGSAGAARRALLIAWSYAQHRRAFGVPLARLPLVAEAIAEMRSETMAIISGSLYLAHLRDLIETKHADDTDLAFFRFAVNLNKYRASMSGTDVIRRAIEILGGNGAMENFSVLPRLLRDSLIFEAWEGAHNTLLAQCLRDIQRLSIHESYLANLKRHFDELRDSTWKANGLSECRSLSSELSELQQVNELTAGPFFRTLANRLMYLFYYGCLAREAEWEEAHLSETTKRPVVDFLWQRYFSKTRPSQEEYLRQLVEVSSEV